MRYRILGPLDVVDGDRSVDLGGHKQRAVLALLLLGGGRVVSTDELIDRLWDSAPPRGAANTLQGYVSNLRRALEPGRARGAPARVLVTRAPGYALELEPGQLDAEAFTTLAAAGHRALEEEDFPTARGLLEEALALWRGDALADFTYDAFARSEIARLDELRLSAVEDRVDADLALGRHGPIAAELPSLVAAHPLRERLRGQLMVALYRSNRQAGALEVYRDARTRLADELGIDPSGWLQSLEEQVLRQDPALDWGGPERAPVPAASPSGFVGRDAELAVLHRALASTEAGAGRLVLVGGEPGIGKTRLLEELLAAATDPLVLWGRSFDAPDAPAFWCWTQVLADASRQLGARTLLEAAGPDAPTLAPLSPDLAAGYDNGAGAGIVDAGAEGERFGLYLASANLLTRLAADRPLVVVLDDLHWASAASLRLLEFLAANLRRSRVLLLASFRDTDARPGTSFAASLARLAREPMTERLTLAGLQPDDVATYIEQVVRVQPDRHLAAAIHERTAGNPFFVAEMVRVLSMDGRLDHEAVQEVPPSIRDVIRMRLSNLSPSAVKVLSVAACARDMFEPAVVAAVLGLSAERVRRLVEVALAHRLVKEASRVGFYRFAHGLIRDTLYADMTALRRAELHRQIALALQELPPATTAVKPVDLAHHFCLGAPAGDADMAVAAARAAAWDAMDRLAFDEAAGLYARALDVATAYVDDDHELRADLLTELGAAQRKTGDLAAARSSLEEAVTVARRLGDATRLGRAALEFGGGFWGSWLAFGAVDRVVSSHLEEALAGVGPDEAPLRVALLSRLAVELYFSDTLARRDELTAEAVALARGLADPHDLATALAARHVALWRPDNLPERLELADEIVRLAGVPASLHALGRHFRMVDRLEDGDMPGVEEDLAACEQLDTRLGEHGFAVQLEWFRATKAFVEGRFEDAERLARRAYAENRRASPDDARLSFGSMLTLLRREQGRLAELAHEARSRVGEEPRVAFGSATALALTLASLGRLDDARLVFEGLAEQDFRRLPAGLLQPMMLAELAEVCAILGDRRRATRLLSRLDGCTGAVVLLGTGHLCWGARAHWRGRLLQTLGQIPAAAEAFEQALAVNDALGARPFVARSQYHLAEVLLDGRPDDDWPGGRRSGRDRALGLLAGALSTATDLGMPLLAARCHELMAREAQPA